MSRNFKDMISELTSDALELRGLLMWNPPASKRHRKSPAASVSRNFGVPMMLTLSGSLMKFSLIEIFDVGVDIDVRVVERTDDDPTTAR